MTKIIFFDTETTGNTENDFLIQLAFKIHPGSQGGEDDCFNAMYKPPIKIPPEASAIHHITNKMVEEKPTFKEGTDFPKIKKIFEEDEAILVAHNAPFDLLMIKKEGINPKRFICTLRVARELDKEGKIGKFNLQYLRYLLELEVEATAHDALGDVLVLEKLFERLKNKIMQENNCSEEKALKKMVEISSHPSLLRHFSFGKHNGKKVEDVVKIDRNYLEWLLQQKIDNDQIDEDWIYTLKHHLGK